MRWQLASTFAFGLMSAACYTPDTVSCGNFLCPKGTECAAEGFCGRPPQVEACFGMGIADYETCSEPADGTCRNGICEACTADRAGCRDPKWRAMTSVDDDDLKAVWVGGRTLAFAVGAEGATWRYDGWSWTVMASAPVGTGGALTGVWGTGEDNLFAVSSSNKIFKWSGDQWVVADADVGFGLYAIAGNGTKVVAAGFGGQVSTLESEGWMESRPVSSMNFPLNGVAAGAEAIYAVGNYGGIIRYSLGDGWTQSRAPEVNAKDLRAAWVSPSSETVAVGVDGTLLEGTGTTWTARTVSGLPALVDLAGVWGDANNTFAIGEAGVVAERKAGQWEVLPAQLLPAAVDVELAAISGADGMMIVVGSRGTVWRYEP